MLNVGVVVVERLKAQQQVLVGMQQGGLVQLLPEL
jgi:hypothetical protein